METRFVRGEDVLMINYTPSGADVDAGEVVIVNDLLGICHRPILDGELGALAANGGTYECTGDAVISAGVHVYWDNSAKKVTETIGSNKYFGKTVSACAGDDELCEVMHIQPGSSAAGS